MNRKLLVFFVAFFCLLSCGQKNTGTGGFEIPPPAGSIEIENGKGGPGTQGWTTETVSEGMQLHTFKGLDEVTDGIQNVFVLDVDLNNSRYSVGFYVVPSGETNIATSTAQKAAGAVAALNATYERTSVFIKKDGKVHHGIENDLISNAVDNWKNDGAVYLDENGKIYLEHSGKGKTLAQQRTYYRGHSCPNIFSSAPMLINDYDPVGESFVPLDLSEKAFEDKYHYEHPYRHQGVTHPRSVIALTKDNHLLLIAIDKDRKNLTVEGMNAKDMTRFLRYHFDPQYALNMDGGGSTTLTINGEVKNTPSGGSERALPTFFMIYDSQKK